MLGAFAFTTADTLILISDGNGAIDLVAGLGIIMFPGSHHIGMPQGITPLLTIIVVDCFG